jgi:hypothetical protein
MTIATSLEVAQAEQNLAYADRLQQYNDVQRLLIEGGEWYLPGAGPATPEEWFAVRRYMGLLEHIQVLLASGVLTLEIADSQLSHRVYAVYRNKVIRSGTIDASPQQWRNFKEVVRKLESMPSYRDLQRTAPPQP